MPFSRPTSRLFAPFTFIFIVVCWMHPPLAITQETVLYSFNGTTGSSPSGGVILDKEGNLYGTAEGGGSFGAGVVFGVARNSDGTWTESTLYEFGGAPDGAYPRAPLVSDSKGHLFGTTQSGGPPGPCDGGCGTVFELARNSTGGGWTEQVIYGFLGYSDGAIPASKLVLDKQGNLYGTTSQGGVSNCIPNNLWFGCGTVFELSPNTDGSWSETILYRFQGGHDGMFPSAVTFDGAVNLLGTSWGGLSSCNQYDGNLGCGTIFNLHRKSSGWVKSTPYLFEGGAAGFFPEGSPTVGASGTLYGTTQNGGVGNATGGYGTVFQLKRQPSGGWTESVLYAFTGLLDGCYPEEGLTLDPAGTLFGEAVECGNSTAGSAPGGTVFKLTPSSGGWTETTLASFQGQATGQQPLGGLTFDSKGNLYGTLSMGGSDSCSIGCGTVFEVAP